MNKPKHTTFYKVLKNMVDINNNISNNLNQSVFNPTYS